MIYKFLKCPGLIVAVSRDKEACNEATTKISEI
jgi:hypothetical protein